MSEVQQDGSIKIGANFYKIGRLGIFDQMIIAKRMMPALRGVVTPEILGQVMAARKEDGSIDLKALRIETLLPALADAIYGLSDDDAERIMRTSLKAVTRKQVGGLFTSIISAQGAALMFDDIKLGDAMQLSWKVIESHLGDFFSTAP